MIRKPPLVVFLVPSPIPHLVGVVDRVDILAGVYIVSEGTNLALTRLLTRAEWLLICETLLSVSFRPLVVKYSELGR